MASAKDTFLPPLPPSLISLSLSLFLYFLYCLFDRYDSGLALIISLGQLHEVVNVRLKRTNGSYRSWKRHSLSGGVSQHSIVYLHAFLTTCKQMISMDACTLYSSVHICMYVHIAADILISDEN